ncbi:MAG TPA: DNA polymerase III subunit beta [Mycobacteriales bacterium]|nr:DNA polymerase III subunit beta [Mycobacteriales bacterium]HVX70318.1 DNA polymerase III subunit beta [Mycobacteriales bacterium]
MKIRVERDAFADAVAWASRILPQKAALPVLSGLRIDAGGDAGPGVRLSGFDYEVSAQANLDVTVAEGGSVLVPGRLLAEITRSLPPSPIDLATDGSRVVVTCGASRFTLPTLPLEEYPTLPEMPTVSGTVGSDAFAAAVTAVAVAAGRDDALPVLTGIRVEIEGEQMTLAATDRYRLAVRTLRWAPEEPSMQTTALIPAKTLADAAKSLTSGAQLSIALAAAGSGEGLIGLAGGDRSTTSRLLDGEFPKYRSLLPETSTATANVDSAALTDAVRRVALVASRTSPIRMSFSADGIELEAGGLDDAAATESLPAEFQGEALSIAFNPTYLLDGLGSMDSDAATLSFTGPTKPAVLTGKADGNGAADHKYLLMPVRMAS